MPDDHEDSPDPTARPTDRCAVCVPGRGCYVGPGGVSYCSLVTDPMPGYRRIGRRGRWTMYVRRSDPTDGAPDADPVDAVRELRTRTDDAADRRQAEGRLAAAVLAGLHVLDRDRPHQLAAVLRRAVTGHPELADLRGDVRELAGAVAALEQGGRP